jgi:hypothetical protein
MTELPVHPLDAARLRDLGVMLCEVSAGERTSRDAILSLVETLMVNCRDDLCADDADAVVDRLLAIADERLGARILAELALAEILAPPHKRPDSFGAKIEQRQKEEAAPRLARLREWAKDPLYSPPGYDVGRPVEADGRPCLS